MKEIRWRWGFLLQRVLALVMVEKAGLGKHRRSREVIISSSSLINDDVGSCDGKVVDGAVHVLVHGHIIVKGTGGGGGVGHRKFPRREELIAMSLQVVLM